jgi:hypothetical protein
MKYVLALILVGAISFAGEAGRPACNSRNHGQFWPEQANLNSKEAHKLFQSGELEMCSLVVWKYKWTYLSVNARKLSKGSQPAAAESKKTSGEGIEDSEVESGSAAGRPSSAQRP